MRRKGELGNKPREKWKVRDMKKKEREGRKVGENDAVKRKHCGEKSGTKKEREQGKRKRESAQRSREAAGIAMTERQKP